jgi:eukaryotic-like serine/threonine-protein kinase
MTITPSTRIGPYEILAQIGVGGMGEVYRARDTKLGRDVAIKVLPAAFSADGERLRRFEQEAQAAGALNHPNILVIFHIGTHDDAPYIASELLEGETLRERMAGAALSQRKAIDYALQVAHGLAAAHAKGIVHRDLKPENLFVTNDGRVKILDFGLAKLTGTGDGTQSQTEVPTRKIKTDPGMVMGTMGYMSPEQLKGQPADHRSDIFSFGAILYEMLAGKRAFRGESMAETMSAILREDPPDLSETNKTISPALERVVRHCLEKNPEERFHSARDLAFAIGSLSGAATSSGQTMTTAALPTLRPRTRERIGWIALTVSLLITAIVLAFLHFPRAPTESVAAVRYTIVLPMKAMTFGSAISPDGRSLLFNAAIDGKTQLWLRPLGSFTARPLSGTEGTFGSPFWSPDSRWIGFLADDKLQKIDPADGTQQTLCNVPGRGGAFGGTWSREGTILFARNGIIYRVSAGGGETAPVLGFNQSRQEALCGYPFFLPDGRHFLYFTTTPQDGASEICLASLDEKETKRLLAADSQVIYVPSFSESGGYLLFAREGALLAQSFDATHLTLVGDPFRVADQVRVIFRGEFSASDTGTLVYDPSSASQNSQLTWFDRTGKRLEAIGEAGTFSSPRLSPDGKRVVVTRRNPKTRTDDIYVIDLARGSSSPLTFDAADDQYPVWSPDGSHIVWRSHREGSFQLYQRLASGVGPEELLLKSDDPISFHSWSADGRFILYSWLDPKTRGDVGVLPVTGDRKPFVFLQTPFDEREAHFSPDGRSVAYISNESSQNEVYLQSFPASSQRWPVSTRGGDYPRWRRDGKELFYLSADGKVMAVQVKTGGAFQPGIPEALFDLSAVKMALGSYLGYDVTADGQRFLFVSQIADPAASSLAVVVNWTADLKK